MDTAIQAVCTDRRFASKQFSKKICKAGIFDDTCPRDPRCSLNRLKEQLFSSCQRRRGSTVARIAILNNSLLGARLRVKSFERFRIAVAWGVVSPDFWVLVRIILDQYIEKSTGLANSVFVILKLLRTMEYYRQRTPVAFGGCFMSKMKAVRVEIHATDSITRVSFGGLPA